MDALIAADRLAADLATPAPDPDPDLVVVDATLLDPALGRDARADHAAGHIPGAVFLDLAALRDTASPLPNTMPDAERLAAHLGALGIGDGMRIVLYDDSPWRSAARAWWLLHSHGIGPVAILDGGLAAWRAAGLPLETGMVTRPARSLVATPDHRRWRDMAQVRAALADGAAQLVDARSPARFTGAEGDPHGAAPGHIPGSRNIPYNRFFDADGRWKRDAALADTLADLDPDRPVVATCGSGITAAVVAFGLHLAGRDAAIYDGSWSEWGRDPTTPKAMGA